MSEFQWTAFNQEDVSPYKGFEPVPPQKYVAAITEAEMKDTSAGTGKFLQFNFEILEGDHKGQIVFDMLNLINPSAQTVEIAKAKLKAICNAVGVTNPQNEGDLLDKPLIIDVTRVKRKDTGEMTNRIKSYHSRDNGQVGKLDAPWT